MTPIRTPEELANVLAEAVFSETGLLTWDLHTILNSCEFSGALEAANAALAELSKAPGAKIEPPIAKP